MLYKYLSPQRLSVITNFKIRFTQPAQLNDPFEAALLVSVAASYEESDSIIEELSKEVVWETDEQRAELEAMKDQLKEEMRAKWTPTAAGQRLAELINRAQGVLSLSRTNDSLLMWAHYADSHRGYVLGLDEKHPFFNRPDGSGNPTKPRNVIYTSKRIVIDAEDPDFHEQLLCIKSLEWAYEQEVRVFRNFSSNHEDFEQHTLDQIHLFTLPKECIKEIYIGANASRRTRAQILETIDRRKLQVQLYEAYIEEHRYALSFRRVAEKLHSYRPEDFVVRHGRVEEKYTDTMFSYDGLPIQITVDYGPNVVYPLDAPDSVATPKWRP